MEILEIFKNFEKIEIEKEIMGEKDVNRERCGACSTSYPSGNQVDGLPVVAILTRGEIAWTCNRANV